MNITCVIGARGGSKGLAGKNIRPLCGKPLIGWSIEQAKSCPEIRRVVVSTDSEAIAEAARSCGAEVPFMRPAELANDAAIAAGSSLDDGVAVLRIALASHESAKTRRAIRPAELGATFRLSSS